MQQGTRNSRTDGEQGGPFGGKVALVTGAGRGIGRAAAIRLAQGGADLALVDVDAQVLDELAVQVRAAGRRALPLVVDVTRVPEVERMVTETLSSLGHIDILINNVGGSSPLRLLEEVTPEDFDRVLTMNLRSTFLCLRAVVPHMKRRGAGRIVNLASLAGRSRSVIGGPQYAAAKAGVIGLTRHLCADLAPFGITINAVAPGPTLSERVTRRWAERTEESRQEALARIPLGRLATVEEVAGVVVFLCSDDARYVTGAVIDVNGGQFVG